MTDVVKNLKNQNLIEANIYCREYPRIMIHGYSRR